MYMKERIKISIVAITLLMMCGTVGAQRHCHRHWHGGTRAARVVAVVNRPQVSSRITNRFGKKERLSMALAYLETHNSLSIRKYADITQLKRATAEAELDAFAMDKGNPIRLVVNGKKKVYVKG